MRTHLYVVAIVAIISMTNAINFPLHMALQLPLVLVKSAADIGIAMPAVAAALQQQSPAMQQQSRLVCDLTLGSVQRVACLLGGSPGPCPLCAGPCSGTAAATFLTLLMGLALPLCLTHWAQQALQGKQAHSRHSDDYGGADGWLSPGVWRAGWAYVWVLACSAATHALVANDAMGLGSCAAVP